MAYTIKKSKSESTISKSDKKKKDIKMPKPLMKPRTQLTKDQKALMKEHKEHHTKEHLKMMTKLMKEGYCFNQAHSITMKKIGK